MQVSVQFWKRRWGIQSKQVLQQRKLKSERLRSEPVVICLCVCVLRVCVCVCVSESVSVQACVCVCWGDCFCCTNIYRERSIGWGLHNKSMCNMCISIYIYV